MTIAGSRGRRRRAASRARRHRIRPALEFRARAVLSRGTVAAAALSLVLGVSACTSGDDPQERDSATAQGEESGAGGGAADGGSPAASDGGAAGTSPLSDAELEDASARFVEMLRVLDDSDWEAACGMVLDPTTGTAPEGERLQQCADGAEAAFAEHEDLLVPGRFDTVETQMVTASDNGDGTVSLRVLEEEVDVPMVQGEDGRWYLAIPF